MNSLLTIKFPGLHDKGKEIFAPFDETLLAEHLDGDRYRLAEHSQFIPLGPGDIVRADLGVIVDIDELLAGAWIIEVMLDNYAITRPEAAAIFENLGRDLKTTWTDDYSVRITTVNKSWVDQRIVKELGKDTVEMIIVLRRPMETMNFATAVRNVHKMAGPR